MKNKSLLLFAVAAGCGLVAMVGAQRMLADRTPQVDTVRVLVARVDIDAGVKLDKESVMFRDLARDSVPEGAIVSEEQFQERALRSRAYAGQVLLVAQLGEKGVFGSSIKIPKGMRLVSLPVTATMTHSGIMKAGDRVDIVLTYQTNKPGVGTQFHTKTILEYIQVFAMGSQQVGVEVNDGKGGGPADVKNVSLLVSPLQAEIFKLAEGKGTLHLTLRSIEDVDQVASRGTDESQLADLRAELSDDRPKEEPTPAPAAAPAPVTTPVVAEAPKSQNFAEFLKGPMAEPAAEPVKKTWKMVIFQGEERKVHEVELPEEPAAPATNETVVQPAKTPSTPNTTPTALLAPVQKWLTGGKKLPLEQPQPQPQPAEVTAEN
jgi:pilus assembly protein CpaB